MEFFELKDCISKLVIINLGIHTLKWFLIFFKCVFNKIKVAYLYCFNGKIISGNFSSTTATKSKAWINRKNLQKLI